MFEFFLTFFVFFWTRNPWDMTKEWNVIFTVFIQACCAAPAIVIFILMPEFLFLAINRYFSTLIEDVKEVIKGFDHNRNVHLERSFIEMVNLHRRSLKLTEISLYLLFFVTNFKETFQKIPFYFQSHRWLWPNNECWHFRCEYFQFNLYVHHFISSQRCK